MLSKRLISDILTLYHLYKDTTSCNDDLVNRIYNKLTNDYANYAEQYGFGQKTKVIEYFDANEEHGHD